MTSFSCQFSECWATTNHSATLDIKVRSQYTVKPSTSNDDAFEKCKWNESNRSRNDCEKKTDEKFGDGIETENHTSMVLYIVTSATNIWKICTKIQLMQQARFPASSSKIQAVNFRNVGRRQTSPELRHCASFTLFLFPFVARITFFRSNVVFNYTIFANVRMHECVLTTHRI